MSNGDTFPEMWHRLTQALVEPSLFTVPGTDERFHAWYDAGGDGKEPAVWTKPLQGAKQVRLPQHERDYRRVYEAARAGTCSTPTDAQKVTARGHYIYTVLLTHGLVAN